MNETNETNPLEDAKGRQQQALTGDALKSVVGAENETLTELFSRDPLKLADSDIDKMVEIYRERRERWLKDETTKQSSPSKREKKAPPKNLSLQDLGLNL